MPSPLEHVQPGQALSAAQQNALVDRLNAVSRLSAGGALYSAHGSGGLQLSAPDRARLAIWQLSGPMERATTDGIPDDVPSAPAVPVWYFPLDGTPPENEYTNVPGYTRSARIYYVAGFPGDQREKLQQLSPGQPGDVAIPRFGPGDWVLARFNPQSGRWEILEGPETLWRFELKTPLQPNGDRDRPSTATAYLVVFDAQQGKYIRTDVEFPVADFLDIAQGQPGDRGYALRLADSHLAAGWEVVLIQPESSSSSSSGEESSSSSGEISSSSSSSSSSSGGGGGCENGYTGNVDVVVGNPRREGDWLYLPMARLRFEQGCLTAMNLVDEIVINLCCPPTSSSSDESSSGDDYPDCIQVDGEISPSLAKGPYWKQTGLYNGKPQWKIADDLQWYIRWWNGSWIIGDWTSGNGQGDPDRYWLCPSCGPTGPYSINSGTEGTAIADRCSSSSSSAQYYWVVIDCETNQRVYFPQLQNQLPSYSDQIVRIRGEPGEPILCGLVSYLAEYDQIHWEGYAIEGPFVSCNDCLSSSQSSSESSSESSSQSSSESSSASGSEPSSESSSQSSSESSPESSS